MVLTSDHGESLGEHDYYFDHGEDLFEPSMAVPLIVAVPGAPAGVRSRALASTLDLVPDAPRPAEGLLSARPRRGEPARGGEGAGVGAAARAPVRPERAEPHRHLGRALSAGGHPGRGGREARPLRSRRRIPAETRDVSRASPEALRAARRELELFQERGDREWARTRPLLEGKAGELPMSDEAREKLCALNYIKCEN